MTQYIAWFVCRGPKNTIGDIALPLKPDMESADKNVLIRQGRMRAARQFKREMGLHPCTKIDAEFQCVMTREEYNAA